MIPLRIKFVVTQKTNLVLSLQGKDILEILFFFLKDRAVCYPDLKCSHICQKFGPKIIYCNLN